MSFGETPLYIFKRRHLQTHCRRRSDGGLTVSTVTLEWIEHGKFQENSALIWEVVFLMFISICFRMISYMNGCCTFRDCGIRGSRCRRKDTDRNNDLVRYCEWFFVSSNASSKHCVPEWFWAEIEDSGPKISTTRIPETHHCGGARPDPEISLQAANVKEEEPLTVVAQQTKVTHTGQTDESVISWGNPDDGGDCSVVSRSAQKRAANSGHRMCICSDIGWWIRGCLGQSRPWWWLLCSSRSAQKRAANSGHRMCICSDIGWWIRGCLGQSRPWWWLLCSSRSAQKRAANSGHIHCICCDLGRWISDCLGQWSLWWWLLRSSRSAQQCAAKFRQTASHLRQS